MTQEVSKSEGEAAPAWNIDDIVQRLRAVRDRSLVVRHRIDSPVKLPSRKILTGIVENLRAAFFPHRLSTRELADESVDFFVGHTLDLALRQLAEQAARELQLTAEGRQSTAAVRLRAAEIVGRFAADLPDIRDLLETDIQAASRGDAAARSVDEVVAYYPGITAITHHRPAHALYQHGLPLIARIIAEIAHSQTGIDIHPGARIGHDFFIDHGTGVVIGETTVIGNRVRLHHGVTLGAVHTVEREPGPQGQVRHPVVEDDVVIYAGAAILGPITIGRGFIIGGNVCLTQGVAPGSRIWQAPVRKEVDLL